MPDPSVADDIPEGDEFTPDSQQLGTWQGKTFEQWAAWDGRGVPLFENCDLENPRQAFLPGFTALPGAHGAPLVFPVEYWQAVSWRLWMLGYRPAQPATLKYQAPASVTASPWNAAGKWVGLDDPEPVRATLKQLVADLPQADKAELAHIVTETFGVGGAVAAGTPDGHLRVDDLANRLGLSSDRMCRALAGFGYQVKPESHVPRGIGDRVAVHLGLDGPRARPEFDPAGHTVTEVLAYLRDASPAEITRVVTAEHAGTARRGVLKRYGQVETG